MDYGFHIDGDTTIMHTRSSGEYLGRLELTSMPPHLLHYIDEEEEYLYIAEVEINPNYRSMGLGRVLMEQILTSTEVGTIYVQPYPTQASPSREEHDLARLINWYDSMGFEVVLTEYQEGELPLILMRYLNF